MTATDTQTATLRELTEIADSGTWGDEGRPGDGSPVLRSSDIADNTLTFHDAAWRSIPENDRARRKLATGDIIVTKSSGSPEHIGKCAVFVQPDDGRDYYFSNFMLRLRAKRGRADHRWLFYWLTSERGRDVLTAMNSTTSGLRNLSVPRYLDQEVPIPFPDDPRRSLAEQKRIAAILDKADAIRRRRQEAARLADTLIPSVFYEMFGDPVTNRKGFPVRPLGEMLDFLTSGSRGWAAFYSNKGRMFLRIQNVGRNRLLLDDVQYVQVEDSAESRRTATQPGDVLVSVTADLGRTAVIPEGFGPAHINQHLVLLRTSQIEPLFLSQFLSTEAGQRQFASKNRAAVKAGLNFDDIKSVQIVLPPRPMQRKFADACRRIERFSADLRVRSTSTDDLFSSLVQRAFRGEL